MSRFTPEELYFMGGIIWGVIVIIAFDWLFKKYEKTIWKKGSYDSLFPKEIKADSEPGSTMIVQPGEAVDPFLENHLRNILLKVKFGEGPNSVKGITFEQNFAVIGSLPIDQIERFSHLLAKYKGDIDLLLKDKKEKAQNLALIKNPDIE